MKLRTQLTLAFVVIFAFMITIAGSVYQNITTLIEAQGWVAHTHEVTAGANLIEKLLIDIETGERGFLITGDKSFLEPYEKGIKEYKKVSAGLKNLVSDNPGQVKRLEEIDALITKWEKRAGSPEIAARIKMDKTGASMEEVSSLIRIGTEKAIVDALMAKINEFTGVEEDLLVRRTKEAGESAFQSIYFVTLGTLLAIVLGIVVMLIISRRVMRQVGGEPAFIAKITEQIARGDLDTGITGDPKAYTGILASVRTMADSLRKRRDEAEQDAKELESQQEKLQVANTGLAEKVEQLDKGGQAMLYMVEDLNKTSSDLKKTKQEIEMRNLELKSVNQELEAFAYAVSHDLRAPLRGIDGFSQVILEEYADKLDEDGKHYLERVRAGTQRMGRLIDDILQLSRAGRQKMKRETVDLSKLAEEIIAGLRQADPKRKSKVNIQDKMAVNGDAHLLYVMLENLLGNAWKYTKNREQAEIEFGSKELKGEKACFVRDNGAGFDMTYADKLFVPFQRLHTEKEFPGTGVGLANVQRIIRRHGGRVWAEAGVGKGATFFFTLGEGSFNG